MIHFLWFNDLARLIIGFYIINGAAHNPFSPINKHKFRIFKQKRETIMPILQTSQQCFFTTQKSLYEHKNKLIALFNGALYIAIAYKGGSDLQKLLVLSDDSAKELNMALSVGAGVVYTMFTYKTLESISLKIESTAQAILSIMAPFSASAFLTAGMAGSKLLFNNDTVSLTIGMLLFALRNINCIDASIKFPERFKETQKAGYEAWQNKDYAEISRLLIIWVASIGYAVCTTDAIYRSTEILIKNTNLDEHQLSVFCCFSSILGALGTLPLNVYWSYRGLRQLTFGGKPDAAGVINDPTDRYTYIGLICVLPITLGILGGATGSNGQMAAKLGLFTDILRVITSVLYSCFAGMPGMASLIRSSVQYFQGAPNQSEIATPLINKSTHPVYYTDPNANQSTHNPLHNTNNATTLGV